MIERMSGDHRAAIEAVWRIESARIVASLVRWVRDIGRAEELAQDAFLAALEQWPRTGIPDSPGAWLMTAAKRRAVDQIRRESMAVRKHELVAHDLRSRERDHQDDLPGLSDDEVIGDERLGLIFTACHPVLPPEGRVALTLRLLGGLTTEEIARAFLQPESTIAQRIVRAKKALARAGVPFEIPAGPERVRRLSSVLEVIYLVFNEGYGASTGDHWIRTTLTDEALRLARIVAELSPGDSEVHGLVALLELQASRLQARVDAAGRPVRLADQSRAAWDQLLIRRGLAALERARAITATPGAYQLQAEIAACHARATAIDETDWRRIAELYAQLASVAPTPVAAP